MASYKSEEVPIKASASKVFSRLSDFKSLGELLAEIPTDKIPADKREMFDSIKLTDDVIELPGGPVGSLRLRVVERTPDTRIRLEGEGTPVPLSLQLDITPVDEESCRAMAKVDLEIPAMLRPMISGPMQKMTEQFAQVLRSIPFS
ncbi:MAG: SRPBCC family protein [Muribaculaceae bacterium]|nr:SRPBCC family protein [Muribaculaceae bacterium]